MDFKQVIEQTERIGRAFEKRSRKFTKQERMLDLVEEVGELAQAMLIVDKRKLTEDPKKRKTRADIADALGDIMFDLILLAKDYEIDLASEYTNTLNHLSERLDEGEFDV